MLVSEIASYSPSGRSHPIMPCELILCHSFLCSPAVSHLFVNRRFVTRTMRQSPTQFIATNQSLQSIHILEFKSWYWPYRKRPEFKRNFIANIEWIDITPCNYQEIGRRINSLFHRQIATIQCTPFQSIFE